MPLDAGDPPSYVTVAPTMDPRKFIVSIMVYVRSRDDYVMTRCSQALPEAAAKALAQSWAKASGREVR